MYTCISLLLQFNWLIHMNFFSSLFLNEKVGIVEGFGEKVEKNRIKTKNKEKQENVGTV